MIISVVLTLAGVAIAVEPNPAGSTESPSPRIALVTARGDIIVRDPGGLAFSVVHRCDPGQPAADIPSDARALGVANLALDDDLDTTSQNSGLAVANAHLSPTPEATESQTPQCAAQAIPATVAWHDGSLYLACIGDALAVWRPGQAHARQVTAAPIAGAVALGIRHGERTGLLIADRDGALWSFDSIRGFEYLAHGPPISEASAHGSPAIRAIAQLGDDLVVAGPRTLWRLRGAWHPLAFVSACALTTDHGPRGAPTRLWLAGAHGLLELVEPTPTPTAGAERTSFAARLQLLVRSIAPATGAAFSRGQIFIVDGQGLRTLASDEASPTPLAPSPSPPSSGLPLGAGSLLRSPPSLMAALQSARQRRGWAVWLPKISVRAVYRQRRKLDVSRLRERGIVLWISLIWTLEKESYR